MKDFWSGFYCGALLFGALGIIAGYWLMFLIIR